MKSQTYDELIRQLGNELSILKSHTQDFIELTERAIGLCDKIIIEFREIVIHDGFTCDEEEIHFFKHIKPCVNSKFIFYTEVFNIESYRPKEGKKEQIRYLRDVVKKYCRYLNDNKEFYQYYKREKTFSDHIYFLRGNADYRIHPDSIMNHIDPMFSTGYDQTLAKILAYEQLRKYVANEIEKLKVKELKEEGKNGQKSFTSNLKWTGSHVFAVELVYSLYYAKVINNGQADIIEIAHAIEKMFNIKLDDIYRTFKDIQGRTTVRTKFLDYLKETLLRRLDDLEE